MHIRLVFVFDDNPETIAFEQDSRGEFVAVNIPVVGDTVSVELDNNPFQGEVIRRDFRYLGKSGQGVQDSNSTIVTLVLGRLAAK